MVTLDERFVQPLLQLVATEYASYLATLSPEDRYAVEQAVRRVSDARGSREWAPHELTRVRLQQRMARCASGPQLEEGKKACQGDARSHRSASG